MEPADVRAHPHGQPRGGGHPAAAGLRLRRGLLRYLPGARHASGQARDDPHADDRRPPRHLPLHRLGRRGPFQLYRLLRTARAPDASARRVHVQPAQGPLAGSVHRMRRGRLRDTGRRPLATERDTGAPGHARQTPAGRLGARPAQPALQRLAGSVARRHGAVDHRLADRPLSLCGHAVVLDPVRSRRHHFSLANALAGSVAGQGRPDLSGLAPGDRDLALSRQPARQDHARNPRRRDERPARGAVRSLLWRCRHHLPVRGPGRRLRQPHRRSGSNPQALAQSDRGRRLDARLWRQQQRRSDRLSARGRYRPVQPGLEGLRGFHLPRRWSLPQRSDRASGGSGLRLRRLESAG